jgi:hypothetical protein
VVTLLLLATDYWAKDSRAGFYKLFTLRFNVFILIFQLVCSSSSMVSMFDQIKSNSFNFDSVINE